MARPPRSSTPSSSALDARARRRRGRGRARRASCGRTRRDSGSRSSRSLRPRRRVLDARRRTTRQNLRGPAYWIRCVARRRHRRRRPRRRGIPIVYLPGYARTDIRAVEEADAALKPLAELQYRGHDLRPAERPGLDDRRHSSQSKARRSRDRGRRRPGDEGRRCSAPGRSSRTQPVDELRDAAPLQAAFFDSLLAPDLDRDVLRWLNDRAAFRGSLHARASWDAFRRAFADRFGVEPRRGRDRRGAASSAGGPARGQGLAALRRGPGRYPHVEERLRDAGPTGAHRTPSTLCSTAAGRVAPGQRRG